MAIIRLDLNCFSSYSYNTGNNTFRKKTYGSDAFEKKFNSPIPTTKAIAVRQKW